MIPSPVAILENLTAIANDWRALAARGTCSSARWWWPSLGLG